MLVGCEEERWFHPRQFVFPDRIHELRTIARYSSDFLNIEGAIVKQDAHAVVYRLKILGVWSLILANIEAAFRFLK